MEEDNKNTSLGFTVLQHSSAPVLPIFNSFMEDLLCFYRKSRNITEN
jgi:hypothetical protein